MQIFVGYTITTPSSGLVNSLSGRLLQQKDVAQRVLDSSIRRRRTRCHTHDHLLDHVLDEWLRHNLTLHRPVGYRVIGSNAARLVNVEGTNASLDWDLQ